MAEKQRILIVDDDYNIAELISLYLTKECFENENCRKTGKGSSPGISRISAQPDSP